MPNLAVEIPNIFPKNYIVAGFTQKNSEVNLDFRNGLGYQKKFEKSQRILAKYLVSSVDKIAFNKQIHSDKIKIITKLEEITKVEEFDGFLTNLKNVFLCSLAADCSVVLLYDKALKVIGSLHSGRVGTQKQIVSKALQLMKTEFGSNPRNILAYLSPSASFEEYNVDKQTAQNWPENFKKIKFKTKNLSQKDLLNKNSSTVLESILSQNKDIEFTKNSKNIPNLNQSLNQDLSETEYLLDIKGYIKFQLLNSGVLKENIEISKDCTIYNHKYNSYRRQKPNHKLMCGFIAQKNT